MLSYDAEALISLALLIKNKDSAERKQWIKCVSVILKTRAELT
jgi:hypothetical protein